MSVIDLETKMTLIKRIKGFRTANMAVLNIEVLGGADKRKDIS